MTPPTFVRPPRGFCVEVIGETVTYHEGVVRRAPVAERTVRPEATAAHGLVVEPERQCSPADMLVELDRVHRRREAAPWVPLGAVFVVYFAAVGALGLALAWYWVALVTVGALVASAAVYFAVAGLDRARGTAYVQYALDGEAAERFARLQRGIRRLGSCKRVWHVVSEARGEGARKYGARLVLRKYRIRPSLSWPPRMRANVAVPTLYSEQRKYFFFPDRVLVYDERGVRALPYTMLGMRGGESLCIEDEDLPSDAGVVETTWLHARPDGTPDPRFPTNRRYPVALYGDLEFAGLNGVRELFQCSQPDGMNDFLAAVEATAAGEWYDDEESDDAPEDAAGDGDARVDEEPDEEVDDELYDAAIAVVVEAGQASIDLLASAFGISFGRAAILLATMERDGYVGPAADERPRAVNRSAMRFVAATRDRNGASGERRSPRRRVKRPKARRGGHLPHEVLGVRENAGASEVAAAYHELAQLYHPDKVASLAPEFQEIAELRMKEINAAYRALRDRR
jgi:DnaJ-domain-containing protein 1